jgi:CRP-like cAMP-binding protein
VAKDELGNIEWLAICTSRERAAIRRHVDFVDVPAGTVLIREGEAPRWFYAVVDGTITSSIDGEIVGRTGAGQPVNELEVLRNEPATATASTDSDVRLLVMGRREFMGMLDQTPGLARRLLLPHIPTPERSAHRRPTLVPLPAA